MSNYSIFQRKTQFWIIFVGWFSQQFIQNQIGRYDIIKVFKKRDWDDFNQFIFGKCKFKSSVIKQDVSLSVGLATGPNHATISHHFLQKSLCFEPSFGGDFSSVEKDLIAT